MAKPTKAELERKKITGKQATSPDGTEHDDVFHAQRYCKCGGILDVIGHEYQLDDLESNWEGRHPHGEEHNGVVHEWTADRKEAVDASVKVRV